MAGEKPHQNHEADSHLPAGCGKGELFVRGRIFIFSPPGKTPEFTDPSSAALTTIPLPGFFWQGHPSIPRQSCFQIAAIPKHFCTLPTSNLGAKASNFCCKLLEQHPRLSTFSLSWFVTSQRKILSNANSLVRAGERKSLETSDCRAQIQVGSSFHLSGKR